MKIKLNKNQQSAVNHNTGPLLVVAGAGTGKTRVITERIKDLVQNKDVVSNQILAITFTDKASKEMLDRLDEVMPLGYEVPWVNTFHSFADRILTLEGLEIGLDSSYKIITYPDQWLLLRNNLFSFDLDYFRPLGNPTKFISAILKFISRLQDEYILPEQLSQYAESLPKDHEEKSRWLELAHIYKQYQQIKLEQSKMDFGDLITWTLKLFNTRPNILLKYQKQFKHVLVDEFQDTNYAQYELIKLLYPIENEINKDRSLLVVGDDSQSIYKFRGAAVSNILEFMQDYKATQMLTLVDNYRSTQPILDASYKLIQNNNPDTLESKLNISKKLVSNVAEDETKPTALQFDSIEDEAGFIVEKIYEVLAKEPQLTYKDIAILARANNHLDPIIFAFRQHKIPYELVGNRGLYDREEIRDIVALLKIIINQQDSISLYRVLNIESFELKASVISKILTEAKYKKTSLWESFIDLDNPNTQVLKDIIFKYQSLITDKDPVEFVFDLLNEISYLSPYINNESVENQLCLKNVNIFLDKIKGFQVDFRQDTNEIPTIVDFVDYIELMIEAGDNPAQAEIEDIDTVKLMTVHASKGLEFNTVFMINLVSDRFPTRDRKDLIQVPEELIKETLPVGNAHLQEERRLFYVGMTRAQKYLYLLSSKSYGGKRQKRVSGYVEETGIKLTELDSQQKNTLKQVELFGVESSFRDAKVQKISDFFPTSLSYSRISDYKKCPLKYKYRYVLNVPTPPSAALSFGITMHDTLRDFHQKQFAGAKVTLQQLFEIYEKNWQPLGYSGKDHMQTRFESGKELLEKYYNKHSQDYKNIKELEKSFMLKLAGVKFYGRIDRVDGKKDSTEVEIVDYKTGTSKTQKEVDKDDQITIYALATQEALKLKPTKMIMHYLEDDIKVSTTRTQDQLENMKEEISEIVDEIKGGNFKAKPGNICAWCEYKDICPMAYRG